MSYARRLLQTAARIDDEHERVSAISKWCEEWLLELTCVTTVSVAELALTKFNPVAFTEIARRHVADAMANELLRRCGSWVKVHDPNADGMKIGARVTILGEDP